MDTEIKTQLLMAEIEEINALIKKWEAATDQETRWAIYLLQTCLERRKQSLRKLLH